jgi:multidrug resistance efflux pump
VDERDLGKVVVGQNVIIQADGLGGKKFTGTVASISAVMGERAFMQAIQLASRTATC